jgi:uracil-DNA glycosylase family 4
MMECRLCPRLASFLDEVSLQYPGYFAAPVPSFGDPQAALLVVGLAPGMHGANRTGRPFTGDHAGILLFDTLYRTGFSNQALGADPNDGLILKNCRITNAVRCLPPQNKPLPEEVARCNPYLHNELTTAPRPRILVALGQISHQAILKALSLKLRDYPFGHGLRYILPDGIILLTSYHCSRYNTQTKRLTADMFHAVFAQAQREIEQTS